MFSKVIQWGYAVRKKQPWLGTVMSAMYSALRWSNQFRHHVVKVVDGVAYELDLAEDIDSTIYFKGTFEPDTVAAIRTFVGRGDVVFDIGANIGWYTLMTSKIVGASGRVVAFEPTAWARRKLARNLKLNPALNNVSLESMALSDVSEAMRPIQLRASWRVFGDDAGVFNENVPVKKLDDYVAGAGISQLDVVKIDVDGYEAKVIAGASQTLSRFRPVLIMEIGAYTVAALGDSLGPMLDTLFGLSYALFDEKTRNRFSSSGEIERSIPEGSTINLVCIHQSDKRLERWTTSAVNEVHPTIVESSLAVTS